MVKKIVKPTAKSERIARLDELVPTIAQASAAAKVAGEERKLAQDEALPLYKLTKTKKHVVTDETEGLIYTGTLVEPQASPRLDPTKLLKALTAAQRKAVTKPVLDQALLDDAVAKGIVSLDTVAQATVMVDGSAPSIRITVTKAKKES